MKKIIFSLTATVLAMTNSICQSNNPHNQVGIDVVNVAKHIYQDYTDGKIKEVTESTFNYYHEKYLSSYQKPSFENFNVIFDQLKKADNSSVIKNAAYSDIGTAFLKKTLENYSITKLVDEVKASKLPETEKESILCVLAINYNLIKPQEAKKFTPSSGKGPSNSAELYMQDSAYYETISNGPATVLWGGLGFITGNSFCGLPCGVVGGIIGLLFGSVSESNTRITPYGGSSNSGGGPGSSGGWNPQP